MYAANVFEERRIPFLRNTYFEGTVKTLVKYIPELKAGSHVFQRYMKLPVLFSEVPIEILFLLYSTVFR